MRGDGTQSVDDSGREDRCQLCHSTDRAALIPVHGARLIRCRSCGLVRTESGSAAVYDDTYYSASYLSDRLEAEHTPGLAGLRARLMDRAWAAYLDPSSSWLRRLALAPIRNRMGGVPPRGMTGDLLDVGCGDGDFIFRARQHGWRVRGSEVNEAAVKSARSAGLEVDLGDLQTINYRPGSFEVVRLWHVLEHVPDPVGLLRQILPLLRPDGVLIIGVPNFGSLARRTLGPRWGGLQPQFHISHFDRSTLRRALSAAGFETVVIRNRSVGTYFSTLSEARPRLFGNPLAWLMLLGLDDVVDPLGFGDCLEAVARRGH